MRCASAGALASTRSARAREALLGGAEAGAVDAGLRGDVIDAVVDDEPRLKRIDEDLGLGHVGPEDRPLHPQPARGAAHLRAQEAAVERPHAAI